MTDQTQLLAQPPEDHIFERYLAGDCSPAESAAVEQWIAAHRADAAAVAAVRANVARYVMARPTPDSAMAVVRLFERLGIPDANDTGVPQRAETGAPQRVGAATSWARTLPSRRTSRWATAARWTVAVAFCAAAIVAVVLAGRTRTTQAPSWGRTYTTRVGQRATITLDDGTRVVLAPASVLRLATGFGRTTRDVSLVGDGYFDVAHTTGAPFTVRTGNVVTRVLGTGFDVSRYPGDRETRVAVTRGKVMVTADHQAPLALIAGLVGFATDSAILRAERDDTTRYTAWRDGRLIFRDTPAPEAILTIGRWYGVDVRLSDATLRAARLNGTIDYASVTDAVLELEILLNAKATYESAPGARTIVTFHARPAEHGTERRTLPTSLSKPTEVGR